MKKVLKNICLGYIITLIAGMPLFIILMYFTYTEKTIAPVLLLTLIIAGLILNKIEK